MAATFSQVLFFRVYRWLWFIARPLLKRYSRLADGWQEHLVPQNWLESDPANCNTEGHPVDLWLQAASGGEARLAAAICRQFSPQASLRILVVTWTRQGREIIEKSLPELSQSHPLLTILVRFAPLDQPDIVQRALSLARPRMLALLETELWPELLTYCQKHNIPVTILNGRITRSTLTFGKYFPQVMKLMNPSEIHAVSDIDSQNFSRIFSCPVYTMPNIKFDLAAQQTDIIQQQQTLLHTNGPVFLFASVRKGEEHKIPGQLERLYKKCPQASVIIAPRHLHRVNAWQEILDDLGFHPVLASKLNKKRLLSPHTVLIWDQFGNLPQLYALADAVFVGGSFKEGGQNFLESLSAGRIPCIGPSADNFLWAMQSKHEPSLIQAGLIYQVHQASEVIDIMTEQLLTAPKGKQVCERFHAWLIPRCGGAAQTACLIQKKLLSLPHTFIQ